MIAATWLYCIWIRYIHKKCDCKFECYIIISTHQLMHGCIALWIVCMLELSASMFIIDNDSLYTKNIFWKPKRHHPTIDWYLLMAPPKQTWHMLSLLPGDTGGCFRRWHCMVSTRCRVQTNVLLQDGWPRAWWCGGWWCGKGWSDDEDIDADCITRW